MPKTLGLWDYIKSAFSAKLSWLPLPPNWMALALFGMFSLSAFNNLGPNAGLGMLLIGTSLEVAYLLGLSTNERFQRYVKATQNYQTQADWHTYVGTLLRKLSAESRDRFNLLQSRCRSVLELYGSQASLALDATTTHGQSLNKFIWIFLQLLSTREAIIATYQGSKPKLGLLLEQEIEALEKKLEVQTLSAELRRSIESKRDIVRQRLLTFNEARDKVSYIDAELDRIEQQVELLREQAAISKDASAISVKIDTVSSSLSETTDWIKTQQSIFGATQDLFPDTPPIINERPKEYQ